MIESQKDLKALLKLCRSQGVTEISIGNTHIKFGDEPKTIAGDVEEIEEIDPLADIDMPLSNEELAALANGGELT